MASKTAPKPEKASIVELQVYLSSRGRSVVHGTVLVGGEMRTVKHELSYNVREDIGVFILDALRITD